MSAIEGKVALISGGASGIGLHYAKALLQNGLKAVSLADINETQGQVAVDELTEEFGNDRVVFIKTDVTDKVQYADAFEKTVNAFNHLDIVINNAGILNDAIWEKEILVNVNATVHGTILGLETYLPNYRSGPEAVIVNISSIGGIEAFGAHPIYGATKHAIIGLSRAFGASEHYKRTKVRVLTLCPGITDTPLISEAIGRELGPAYKELAVPIVTIQRQTPEFVANCLITMINEGKSGSVWVADGEDSPYEIDLLTRHQLRKK